MHQLAGCYLIEDAPERRSVRLEHKELAPEAFGFVAIVVVLNVPGHQQLLSVSLAL